MADENEKSLEDIIAQAMKNKNSSNNEENIAEEKSTDDLHKNDLKFKYYDGDEELQDNNDKHVKVKKKTSAKKKAMIVIGIILGILLVFLITAGIIIHHYISKLNLVDPAQRAEIVDSIDIDDLVSGPDSPKDQIDSLEDKIKANLNKDGLMQSDDVMNILLLGTDARSKNERGRSDSMILVSINKATKEIVMTSFLRDIYLAIPDIESTRLNHAYAYGGADLVIDTLEQNFKIKIDKYAQVDFSSFITVVDAVGGVEINVTDEELPYITKYLVEINKLEGDPQGDGALNSAGKYTLNGKQALAYSRIRYVGTDFARTERQRTVLEKIIEKAADLSLGDLDELVDELFPNITTNLTESELFSMIIKSPTYFSYDLKQCRVPMDDTYEYLTIRSMSVLGIDFDKNKKYLYKNIYNVD
ncbi:MAG: LCP family protein [Ruminococcus sp.]|nr:LCP family protein [Ruminococcus sp.]